MWRNWFRRSPASAAARYAAEVLYAGWIPPLAPVPVRTAVPARTRRLNTRAFLKRVYSNQRC